MKYFLMAVAVLLSSASYGGGSALPMKVENLVTNGLQFHVALKIAEDHSWYEDKCQLIKVSGSYDAEKWDGYKGRPMNAELHQEALTTLALAREKKALVWFGYLGNGMQRESACTYLSKGLIVERGYIYSIYDSI
jgi:hypothetical protein